MYRLPVRTSAWALVTDRVWKLGDWEQNSIPKTWAADHRLLFTLVLRLS